MHDFHQIQVKTELVLTTKHSLTFVQSESSFSKGDFKIEC